MRDMNPRSACRRTLTLMEIHMTTYKPTGEKPDEFNLYLQERMAALGLDPKTIAENTGIALPTVLTHLNLPGKPIKARASRSSQPSSAFLMRCFATSTRACAARARFARSTSSA